MHQSGLQLSIVQNLCKAFDAYLILEVCGVFLDISQKERLVPRTNIQSQVSLGFRFSIKSYLNLLEQ